VTFQMTRGKRQRDSTCSERGGNGATGLRTCQAAFSPVCKTDRDSTLRSNSPHEFGNGLIYFYSRVGGQGDEEDVSCPGSKAVSYLHDQPGCWFHRCILHLLPMAGGCIAMRWLQALWRSGWEFKQIVTLVKWI